MYRNILVAIDDSETSKVALNEAIHLARHSEAQLVIVHVADETLMGMHGRTFSTTLNLDEAINALLQAGRELLDQASQAAEGLRVETRLLEARQHRVSEIIANEAKHIGADLIVVGRHGKRGLATLILGSVAEQVAKIAEASVLLVRNH